VAVLVAAIPVAAQQGSVQLSSETQFVGGNSARATGEIGVQPDLGIIWLQPGTRFGQFLLETRATRRDSQAHLGRTWLALRDAKTGHVTWTLEAGDIYTPANPDYQFSNLSAPAFTLVGGSATAKTSHVTLQVVGGQTTALRNIFGSDPQRLDQSLGVIRTAYQPSSRVQVMGRAARVRTSDLQEFTKTIDASDEAGGGTRVIVTPSLQFIADGGYVRYRATGALKPATDYSYLFGAHLLLSRGWVQMNASRFSPGEMPILNASLQDRGGVFAAGEYDVLRAARVFGGWETVDTNIKPTGSALLRPQATANRGFGGVRVRVTEHSSVSVRVEEGDRVSRPVLLTGVQAINTLTCPECTSPITTSDTGVISADWQASVSKVTAFARYARRENVDYSTASSTFTQQDSSGQLFFNVSRSMQIFGTTMVTHQAAQDGSGSTFLQVSGGAQRRVWTQGLWMRVEGTKSSNRDLLSGALAPRDALSVGLNGQLTRQTSIGLNLYVDRASIGLPADAGWLSRSTLRIVHTIPTGSVRVSNTEDGRIERQIRGTASLLGSVFADWNGNGVPDPGEEQLPGIPLRLGATSRVTTGRDGQFAFLNVPAGSQVVSLDLVALPVDFDAPAAADISVDLARGATKRVAFGLVPLGAIRGRIVEDVNHNGIADPGEPAVDGAVVTLDGGQRSELVQKGAFRFDAVRSGDHRVELLTESLPDGTKIADGTERAASITREHPQVDVNYVVTIEKRPEVRKVFPPRFGANNGTRTPATAAPKPAVAASKNPARLDPTPRPTPSTPAPAREAAAPVSGESFTVQIAALSDGTHARALVERLKRSGFDAYVVEPGADAHGDLFRVRVGRFESRAAAQQTALKLQRTLRERPWIARE
jgi:cell division septation protein DedD